jgi:hypothetical protein
MANLQSDFQDSITAQIRDAEGSGFLNTIQDILDTRAANAIEADALGLDPNETAGALFWAQLNSVLSGLDETQLNAVLDAFSDEALVTGVQSFISALDDGTTVVANASAMQSGLTARSNTASGLGLINTINDMLAQRDADATAASDAGMDVDTTVGQLFNDELLAVLSSTGLSTLQALLDSSQITDDQTRAVIELRIEEEALAVVREAETKRLNDLRNATQRYVNSLQDNTSALRSAAFEDRVDPTSPLSSFERLQAIRDQVEATYDVANDNTPLDDESLQAARDLVQLVDIYNEASLDYFGNTEDRMADWTRGQEILNSTADRQESLAEQQLGVLRSIDSQIADLGTSTQSPADIAAAAGFNFGTDVETNRRIYNALAGAGLPTPSGFGNGQLGPLRDRYAAVDAVVHNIVGYSEGGLVTGGVPGRDSVLAALEPGERVLSVLQSRMIEDLAANQNDWRPVVDEVAGLRVQMAELIQLNQALVWENAEQRAELGRQTAIGQRQEQRAVARTPERKRQMYGT